MDIVDTAVGAGSFKTLVAAVKAAGLVEALKGEGPFTVFAPSDEATIASAKDTIEAERQQLAEHKAALAQVKADFDRQKTLYEEQIASQLKFQGAERKLKEAEAKVAKSEAYVSAAENELSSKQNDRNAKEQKAQVDMGYVSRKEHALLDTRLYLPREWTRDRKRRKKAGVPSRVRYQTRHQLCLEMLKKHGPHLPHAWITGDDEMGRSYAFRRDLQQLGEQYLLAVPSNTLIRDLQVPLPVYCGTGRKPNRPWQRVDQWDASISADEWTTIDVRDGAKGPLIVVATTRRVLARASQRREGHEETLVIFRYRDRDKRPVIKTDYYLSNASIETSRSEFARVAKAEHRIEECLQRSKSEAGLADYEVRTWTGWHHHQTLSLIATWFLLKETRRGKNGRLPSRSNKSAKASRICFARSADAVCPGESSESASNA